MDRLVKEAESHSEEDRRQRERIETRNQADSLAYQMEKLLSEHGDKIPQTDRDDIEQKIKRVREVMEGDDVSHIRSAMRTTAG